MSEPTSTGSGTSNTLAIGWVREEHVEALVHASDDFNLLLAIALAFLGAAVAAAVALAAGALHPLLLYLIVAGAGGIGGFAGLLANRERGKLNQRREAVKNEARYQYVPSPFAPLNFNAGTSEVPSVTVGDIGTLPDDGQAVPESKDGESTAEA
jgi:hypothetical protein